MKKILKLILAILLFNLAGTAQLTMVPDGGNKKAIVGERVGLTDVTIVYNRPAVKGREGKIWGELVKFGFTDQQFGTSKAAPWRAGANESTTIEFSNEVTINGKPLAAGRYGFYIAVGKEESTLIFSKNSTAWGSFFYEPSEDVLRVACKQQQSDHLQEFLQFNFVDQTANAATVVLEWEKWKFPFRVETDLKKDQVASFRRELQSDKGFSWQAFAQAANWCADNNTNLEEGLQWADYAISGQFIGERNFRTLSTKAKLLALLGKTAEADAVMKEAIPLGTAMEVHLYARQLLAAKKNQEAAEVFRSNYKRYPNTFTTNMGMVRALSSEGKYKEALRYATAALPQAPDDLNKASVKTVVEKLKAGSDVN
jgi:hypothetical protein